MSNIGVKLTADDQQLLAVLKNVKGELNTTAAAAESAFTRTSSAAATAARQIGQLEAQTGMTAKGMNAALRTIPAQFTDIVVSLQGGQPALQVLLQQGGQLKDTFGGILPAFRALGGYVVGLLSPLTLLAAAAAVLGTAFLSGREEMARMQRQLILSGGAAGVTAFQMTALAESLDDVGGGTQGRAAEVLLQMAAAGIKGTTSLRAFTDTAIELERAGGPAVEETVKAFAALGKEPVTASLELNKTTGFLTLAIFDQIKALEGQGRAAEAAMLAQTSYDDAMKARLPALQEQLGYLSRAWRGITDTAKEAWDSMLNIGRPGSLEQQLADAERLLAVSRDGIYSRNKVPERQAAVDALQEQIRLQKLSSTTQAEQNARTQDAIKASGELTKYNERALSSQEKMTREIAAYRRNVEAVRAGGGTVDAEQVKRVEAAITESYTKKATATRSYNKELDDQQELMLKLSGFSRQYAKDAALIDKAYQSGLIPQERALQLQKDLLALQPGIRANLEAENKAIEARNKLLQAAEDDVQAYLDAQLKAAGQSAEAAEKALAAAKDEVAQFGMLKSEIERVTVSRLEDKLAGMDAGDAQAASVRREIEARRELIGVMQKGEAQEAAKEWSKVTEEIGQGLTDSLFRAFESGRGFFRTLWDGIKNTLKTTVLRVVLQPVQRGVAGMIGGFTGGAQAGTGGVMESAGNLWGQIGPWLTDFGGSVETMVTSIANSMGSREMQGWLAQNSGTLAQYSQFAGDAIGYLGAFKSAMDGQYGAAIGSAVGTYFGGPIGTAIGNMLGTAIDKLARGGAGTPHMGSVVSNVGGTLGTRYGDDSTITNNFRREVDDALRALVTGSTGIIQAITGETVTATAKFAADSANASIGQFILSQGSDILSFVGARPSSATGGGDFARFANDPAAGLEEFAAEVARATREALLAADLPQFARDQINALGDNANLGDLERVAVAIQKTTEAIGALQDQFRPLGGALGSLADLSADAFIQLASAAGGFDQLQAAAATYYTEFFTDAERLADEQRRVSEAFRTLGLTMPTTREAFRDMVEDASRVTTDAGREQLAALLNLSGAVAGLIPVAEDATDSIEDIVNAMQQLRDFRGDLQGLIEETRLATLSPEARIQALRASEAQLFADLGTSSNPAAVAQRLQEVLLRRIREEARLQEQTQDDALQNAQDVAALEEEARREQIAALREQITGAERLRDLASSLADFSASLRSGDLSPLTFQEQLRAAQQQYEATLAAAYAGDANAQGNVAGAARAYLEEARAYFGSSAAYAEIFTRIVGQIDQGALDAGAAGSQADALAQQLAAIEASQRAIEDAARATIDTSAAELAALQTLDAAIGARIQADAQQSTAAVEVAQAQVAEQQATTEAVRDSVAVSQAGFVELRTELQNLNEQVSQLVRNADLQTAEP